MTVLPLPTRCCFSPKNSGVVLRAPPLEWLGYTPHQCSMTFLVIFVLTFASVLFLCISSYADNTLTVDDVVTFIQKGWCKRFCLLTLHHTAPYYDVITTAFIAKGWCKRNSNSYRRRRAIRQAGDCLWARRRSTRAAPRGSLHEGRSTGVAPRGPLHGGVADLFYTDLRSILMVLWHFKGHSPCLWRHFNPDFVGQLQGPC